ncbi:MAG: nuclear transport factor 2 family protein [Chitinophagaceae bacterium]|nr:nuclear transport factor 2 family protein [Chitinophagaceae bacterium]
MKQLAILIAIILFSSVSFAQWKEEKSILAAIDQLKKAMISGERSALEAIASDKLSYGHSSGLVENKAEFVEHIASGKSDFVTIDLSEQTITIEDNIAVVRHLLNATTNDNNTPGTARIKVLLVWKKEHGKWKLLARQAVKVS